MSEGTPDPDASPFYDGDPTKLARWRPRPASPPSLAVWEITLRCDLGCSHCGSRAGKARQNELATAEALSLVHELSELGIREVTLIGGEFYLRDDWDIIAHEITRCGMLCSIVTGARQMTPARVERASAAGVGKISLSIDGLEDTHDALRASKGSWRAAMEAGRLISDAGIDLSVNTQINRLTMPELPRLAELLADIGIRSWMVILTAAMGRGADHQQLMLQPYHLLYLFPMLARIKETILDPREIGFFPANNIGYFGPLAETLRYGAERNYAWSGCDAGVSSLGIEADGRIKGCPSLPTSDYTEGNIRDRPLEEIWAARQAAGPIAKTENLWGFCRTCRFAERCRGGCTWTSHVLFGRPGNNPYCHYRALEMADLGLAEIVVPTGAAPGEPFDFGKRTLLQQDLSSVLADDPVVERTLGSQVFGLKTGSRSAWSTAERAAIFAEKTGTEPAN